jgi:hypothetical protein
MSSEGSENALANQELSGFLVLANLTQSDSARAVTVRLLDATCIKN